MAFKNEVGNMDKLREMYKELKPGYPIFTFRKEPYSEHMLDKQAFFITQLLRTIYGLYKNILNKEDLTNTVKTKTNEKILPLDLASKILALEECDKKNWFEGYFPPETYEIIIEHCKKSFNAADEIYRKKYREEPRLKEIKQEILRSEFELLKKGKFRIYKS